MDIGGFKYFYNNVQCLPKFYGCMIILFYFFFKCVNVIYLYLLFVNTYFAIYVAVCVRCKVWFFYILYSNLIRLFIIFEITYSKLLYCHTLKTKSEIKRSSKFLFFNFYFYYFCSSAREKRGNLLILEKYSHDDLSYIDLEVSVLLNMLNLFSEKLLDAGVMYCITDS